MGGQRRTRKLPVRSRQPSTKTHEIPKPASKTQGFWKRKPLLKAASIIASATIIAGGVNTWLDLANKAAPVVSNIMPKDLSKATEPRTPILPTAPVSGYSGGWGPARQTFTMARPAGFPVLNSITDQPNHGDERNFVQIKRSTEPGATRYREEVAAKPGDRVTVYAYVENAAADNIPSSKSTIHGLTARLVHGRVSEGRLTVGVVYDGKDVASVWDGAAIDVSDSNTSLQFINGSMRFITNHSPEDGFTVPDGEFAKGKPVAVGQTALDGDLPIGKIEGKGAGTGYLLFDMIVTHN